MIKIMMHGCNGKMGRMITEIVKNDENAVITAGVDTYTETPNDYPVFDSVEKCTEDVYDRSTVRQKRDAKEIGISALRGGTIVGEHEVIFAGTDEVIEFKHTAYSRSVFGKGAVEAAKFLAGKESGMYDMSDVVGL